jgi:hypothetical protein
MDPITIARIVIATLTLFLQLRNKDGDDESAVIGLTQLVGREAGMKEGEMDVIVPELQGLISAIRTRKAANASGK